MNARRKVYDTRDVQPESLELLVGTVNEDVRVMKRPAHGIIFIRAVQIHVGPGDGSGKTFQSAMSPKDRMDYGVGLEANVAIQVRQRVDDARSGQSITNGTGTPHGNLWALRLLHVPPMLPDAGRVEDGSHMQPLWSNFSAGRNSTAQRM